MFGFSRKKTEPPKACACGFAEEKLLAVKSIRVLGADGCATCHTLLRRVEEVVQELGINPEIEFIGDIKRVVSYGVMGMPGLVVNEKAVSAGKLLKNEEIKKILLETKE